MTQPGAALDATSGREIVLDAAFAAATTSCRTCTSRRDGRAVVTRWSGVVHVVAASGGRAHGGAAAQRGGRALLHGGRDGDRVCATYCADVSVVCAALP